MLGLCVMFSQGASVLSQINSPMALNPGFRSPQNLGTSIRVITLLATRDLFCLLSLLPPLPSLSLFSGCPGNPRALLSIMKGTYLPLDA